MRKICSAFSLLFFIIISSAIVYGSIPSSEREALIALYNSTNGDSWYDNSGWKTPPLAPDGFAMPGTENTWYGITCDAGNTTVLEIDLHSNNLSGNIPIALSYLPNLVEIWLYNNGLTGSIPPELGNLSNLEYLVLDWNQLTGSIPPELGNISNLYGLDLSDNQLTGSIPPKLGYLSNLNWLDLHSNQLTGSIPPELGNLSSLEWFELMYNELSGTIPPELGYLSSLQYLWFGGNQFSGSIPPELGNLFNLYDLVLWGNQLTGSIPPELGNISSLYELTLSGNELTGNIPSELGNLSNLVTLDLGGNQLTGKIPRWLINLTYLDTLDLRENNISGTITGQDAQTQSVPLDLGSLSYLYWFDISKNQLSGKIPAGLGSLTNIAYLYLNGNKLGGEIPVNLVNMTNLTEADIGYNALYTDNGGLQTFLNGVDPDWKETQTIVPEDVHIVYLSSNILEVRWTPILYTSDPGGYRILGSTSSGGPYILYDTTSDKTASEMECTLPNPNKNFYIVVQTRTDPHGENQNTVDTKYCNEVTTADKPEINVRFGNTNFSDEGSYNLGNKPASLIKTKQFDFTIENLGESPVLLTGSPIVQLTGVDADKFTITQPTTDILGVGESMIFTLEADAGWADLPPGSIESVAFSISIDNNDADEHPYNFTIAVSVVY